MTRGGAAGWIALLVGLLVAPVGVRAQEPVDSTRLRVLRQLELLGRPPGYDSLLFRQDSLAQAEGQVGRARPGGARRDSTLAQLAGMRGYSATEYTGGRASFEARNRVLVLQSSEQSQAHVTRDGMEVEADSSITFDDRSGRVRTTGASRFTPETGDPVRSRRLVFDLGEGRGSAFDAETEYTQAGARWFVTGDMPFAAPDSSFMSHARFTSCDLTTPHYHFETDRIKIINGRVLVAAPVRMYFADVPVGWLPFVAQSLSSGRSSGLLTPRFSVNDIVRTSSGYSRRVSNVGFYWAMSDYSDALVALDWWSNNFLALTGGLQYRINRQFLNGGVNFRQYWREGGGTEFSVNTQHSWEYDERTRFQASGQYATSTDFVRQNSFDPAEVTQSIDSEGGLSRRFDWGQVSLGANRKEYLSDDRVEWTLPSGNVSLSSITLFPAPSSTASFWNNMTWSGGTTYRRSTVDRIAPDTFSFALASTERTTSSVRSNLSLGSLTLGQSVQVAEAGVRGVPEALLALGDSAPPDLLAPDAPSRDISQSDLTWSASANYQQQLIGSTTLTPRVSFNGRMFRADTSTFAPDYVAAPSRVTAGVQLKSDIYGFYPGFGGFEALRHKISPSISYDWSPETNPTQLQDDVFGSRVLQRQSVTQITINQTWEAKRPAPETPAVDSAAADSLAAARRAGEPRRLQRGTTVKLLGLTTSAVEYDFVEADSTGFFLGGFQTTRLTNTITSDFLRGLNLTVVHDLFEDSTVAGRPVTRSFSPHLAGVNTRFSIGSSSGFVRWLGALFGGEGGPPPEEPSEEEGAPLRAEGATGEASIIPGAGTPAPRRPRETRRGAAPGGWTANFSYSLQRPRAPQAETTQMLQMALSLRPTVNWNLSWRTAYDLERNAFNDHTIRLTRDLHRWEASFDFLQTATGNWSFRFEVSLIDNRDLKFDYKQRNLDVRGAGGR